MKPSIHLGLVLPLSVASAALTTLFVASERRGEPTSGFHDSSRLDELVRRQCDLEASVLELRATLESSPRPDPTSQRLPVIDESAIEHAVTRVLEARERGAIDAEAKQDGLVASKLLSKLRAPGIGDAERARIWRELHEGGHIDAAVAEFERLAEAAPYDPVAQTQLGQACFQKLATTGGGPEAGRWGSKGAEALERALELDATDWDARFSLAQHFDDADMRGDSIRHLERLIEQQGSRVPETKHASAYLLLGNLYMNGGDLEAAKRVWKSGLQVFPQDAVLQERLRGLR